MTPTAPEPTDSRRERAKEQLHEALHTLGARIPNLGGDCHCNLLAEVALDAVMPIFDADDLAAAEAVERARDDAHGRINNDPVAHAVAHVLRSVLAVADDGQASTDERQQAILDGTTAILALVDPAERRGYLRAIADLRDRERWAEWCAAEIVKSGFQGIDIWQPIQAADYLEHKAGQTPGGSDGRD